MAVDLDAVEKRRFPHDRSLVRERVERFLCRAFHPPRGAYHFRGVERHTSSNEGHDDPKPPARAFAFRVVSTASRYDQPNEADVPSQREERERESKGEMN